MTARRMHKWKTARRMHKWKTLWRWFSVCGWVPQENDGTDNWHKVDCKRCLAKRPRTRKAKR